MWLVLPDHDNDTVVRFNCHSKCLVFFHDRFPDQPTAADIVNHLDPNDISDILKGYADEKMACRIANGIVDARYAFGNITRTSQLAKIVNMIHEG